MNLITFDYTANQGLQNEWRIEKVIKLHNIFNSRDKFEEFKFIGLNDFDLFTSDFLL